MSFVSNWRFLIPFIRIAYYIWIKVILHRIVFDVCLHKIKYSKIFLCSRCCLWCESYLKQKQGKYESDALLFYVYKKIAYAHEGARALAIAKTEAETERPIRDSTKHHIQSVLHHDVNLTLRVHTASLQKSKTCKQEYRLTWQHYNIILPLTKLIVIFNS